MKAEANRLHRARQDMLEAGSYAGSLEYLLSAKDDNFFSLMQRTLSIALMVVYARPFVHSISNGKADPKVLPGEPRLFDGEIVLRALHLQIINLRNSAVAHPDWRHHRTELTTSDKQYGLRRKHFSPDYMQGINLDQLRRLIKHVEVEMRGGAYDLDVFYQVEVEKHS